VRTILVKFVTIYAVIVMDLKKTIVLIVLPIIITTKELVYRPVLPYFMKMKRMFVKLALIIVWSVH